MRSFRSSAIILTLFMLLLVAGAAFVFLLQGDLRLRNQVLETQGEADEARQLQAQTELQLGAAEATRDATFGVLATAEHNGLLLEGQLVESEQEMNALETRVGEAETELEAVQAAFTELQETAQNQPPNATVVAPQDGATLQAGQPVAITIVAGDSAGLSRVQITIDGSVLGTYSVNGQTLFTRTTTWTPPAGEGTHTIGVTAVNANGLSNNDTTITVTVASVPTPTPTVSP